MNQGLLLFIISGIILLVLVFGLCIKIIFKKNGSFPTGHVSDSKELRDQGITCAQAQDEEEQARTYE